MKLKKLLNLLMYHVDIVEYYNDNMTSLYSFSIDEIPENAEDEIVKFNIYEKDGKRILEVIKK